MKTHDLVFANRPNLRFINKIFYGGNDVAFSSYGEKWRYMKSICVTQLLSRRMVQSFRPIREEEVARVIEEIKSYDRSILNLSGILLALFKGIINRTALGRTCTGVDENGIGFYKLIKDLLKVMGKVSVGDYVPTLRWVDRLSGLERQVENMRKQFDDFIETIIQEHEIRLNSDQVYTDEGDEHRIKDFVDVLLKVQSENPEWLSRDNIKAIILVSHSRFSPDYH
ncbi:cytochrome P450 71A20-like [Chenopodium quinoa]|uniref:cytochrome P450 71A20-like n=1 Tax=Chenopodium quinoa TaxID=63459 RepID=UPI000B76EBDA|nr:cytochrome P450 71A20-like [Chenopodium quinoa]